MLHNYSRKKNIIIVVEKKTLLQQKIRHYKIKLKTLERKKNEKF